MALITSSRLPPPCRTACTSAPAPPSSGYRPRPSFPFLPSIRLPYERCGHKEERACRRRQLQRVRIGLELTLGKRMAQPFGILLKRPIRGVLVDVGPMEPLPAVRRIPEVIHLIPLLPQAPDHLLIVRIPPAGCAP